MKKQRTILDSVKTVLKESDHGMTFRQIYLAIISEGLYEFGAKNPESVVRNVIRSHCIDTDYPTSSPIKVFRIDHEDDREVYYALLAETQVKKTIGYDSIPSSIDIEDEMLPEEKIVCAYEHYIGELKKSLIIRIMDCHPSFFERMVVDLLLSMGYGCDDKSGRVIGKSHDGGIDGIISEDKLGLNLIYVQAKRYNEGNNVGRPEIQRFVGAMQKAEKGVFITTSGFTKEALDFANAETRKHIKLIDGDTLVSLMIRHSVGLEKVKEYAVFKINEDYFTDTIKYT